MGIPSYFSFIIKNYKNIVRNHEDIPNIDHLCMDCNSIIYDSFYEIEATYKKSQNQDIIRDIESILIQSVIRKIELLISEISPKKTVFITFDGVAPFAKMNQQRKRRYKSSFMANIQNSFFSSSITSSQPKIWNTTAITPGTPFMNKLSEEIYRHFNSANTLYDKIQISCSDQCGEGEHKIFQWIRDTILKDDIVSIYGLDSDLIMLSIFHKQYTDNIYVFREAPEFRSVLESATEKGKEKQKLFIDINKLSQCIFSEMGTGIQYDFRRVYDYIFICFLLGNDFLPHIISLNIRTIGIQVILDTYKQIIGKYPDRSLIHPHSKEILWKYVGYFISELAKKEHSNLIQEHTMRDKFDRRVFPSNTQKEKEDLIENIPIIYRVEEKFICPEEKGWESRYYQSLFDIESTQSEIYSICENYIEGLAWIFQYYTQGSKNNQWKYNYHYAPLLVDLKKYIGKVELKSVYEEKPICSNEEQLKYVIPPDIYYDLFPSSEKKPDPVNYSLKWAYCRYLWEAHPIL